MKFPRRQKDIPTSSPLASNSNPAQLQVPPMVAPPSDLASTNSRVPLPPVSENGTLQATTLSESHTPPKTSATYSRPTSALHMPQFAYTNTPHPHNTHAGTYFPSASTAPSSTTPPPLFSNNSNGMSTKIDIDRIMKQDEAAMNDFVPPRQAMNSDESDFDWDEDINIDDKVAPKKKDGKSGTSTSKWRRLSPLLRMTIMILVGCPIVALPAILTQKFKADDPPLPEPGSMMPDGVTPVPDPPVPKTTIVMIFVWLSFMWGIIFLTNWGVDIVPVVVVRVTSVVTSYRLENVKSKLLIFVATKKYLKWLLASCWAIGSLALLSKGPYSRTDEKLNPVFLEVLSAFVAGAALVFVEKIMLHVISTNFHQTAYADRIKENKYALAVLDRLSTSKKNVKKGGAGGGRPTHSRHNTDLANVDAFSSGYRSVLPSRTNSIEMNGVHNNNNNTVNGINDLNNGVTSSDEKDILQEVNGDESPQKLAEAMVINTTPLTTPTDTLNYNSGNPLNSHSRQSTLVSTGGRQHHHHHHRGHRDSKTPRPENNNIFKGLNRRLHGIALANKSSPSSKDVGSTANAKRLAKTLFYNLIQQQQGYHSRDELIVQDFYPYFSTEEDAQAAFNIFDKDGNGDISKSEMKEKIFYVYKERKDLHTSLRDLSQAVGKLDVIFLTIVAVIWLLIVLSIFGKDVVKNMLSIGSFLVALSFVFGNSLKILFENIVFLFITHPYDSGDLVSIDGNDMYVREVGLNSTIFVTWDGKRMYYPNNLISTRPIHNVRRSPNMTDKIVLNVDCYTTQAQIFELRARMRDYLVKESKEFLPDLEIQIQEMDIKLKISMCIEHKGNWQDSGRRWARRTAFNYALKEAVEDIGIKYYALPQRLELYDPNQNNGQRTPQSSSGRSNSRDHDDQDTLAPNSPLRNYTPEQVARLYRRTTINRPQGE
ncbi:hypothetical protein EMPS_08626 [Entomortierella parvispora]|uniref:EF-hand domain-containing protein n=1 Tax=Entomortierella parvispora TaxID=205924 RepID=A0A9P3LZM0_9FUNG|nr:hypothetical protein EMPS_08626 [Entomortierella parvispora]